MNSDLAITYYNLRCHDFASLLEDVTSKLNLCPVNSRDYAKLAFWKYFAIGLCGSNQSAIRGLESLRKKCRFIEYAILAALKWFHERCGLKDEANLQRLCDEFQKAENSVHVDGALLAADFFFQTANYDSAYYCVNLLPVLHCGDDLCGGKEQEIYAERYRIMFWIALSNSAQNMPMSYSYLICSSLNGNIYFEKNVDCLMIKSKYYEITGNGELSIKILNDVIESNPMFYPALIESAKQQFKCKQYALARSLTQRALKVSKNSSRECIEIYTLLSFVTVFKKNEQISNLKRLVALSSLEERSSPKACYKSACLFSSICDNGYKQVLSNSLRLVSLASRVDPTNELYHLEKAQILLRLNKLKDSYELYQSILKTNEDCIEALLGCVLCQILSGNKTEAYDQLDFISITVDKEMTTKEAIYQKKIIGLLLSNNEQEEIIFFSELLEALLTTFSNGLIGINGDFFNFFKDASVGTIDVVAKYFVMKWSRRILDNDKVGKWTPVTEQVVSLLKSTLERFPCNTNLWIMFVKICFQQKHSNEAKTAVYQCFTFHPELVSMQLLKAQIELEDKDIPGATQSLERALSMDLEICHHPFYKFLKGSLSLHLENTNEARVLLTSAYEYCMQDDDYNLPSDRVIFTYGDSLLCHLNLCKSLKLLNETELFRKICLKGEHRFVGTSAQFHFVKMQIDFFLEQDEIEKALMIMGDISPESSYYGEAQLELASIYLNRKKNITSFLQCYEKLGEFQMLSKIQIQSFVGDAYMNASYFRHALIAYSIAVNKQDDLTTSKKHGDLLITCQYFRKAIIHLETLLESQNDVDTALKLIYLYINTQELFKVMTVLKKFMKNKRLQELSHDELSLMTILLNISKAITSDLSEENVAFILDSSKREYKPYRMDSLAAQAQLSNNYCGKIKEIISELVLQEADCLSIFDFILQHVETNCSILFAALKVAYKEKKYDICRKYCNDLRKLYPCHEGAVLVSGRLLMKTLKFNDALSLYKNFITLKPFSYSVILEQLKLLQRTGRSDEIELVANKLQEISSQMQTNNPHGYFMCMGTYFQISGEPGRALEYLNYARCDSTWCVEATMMMVEIYLQLDDSNLWQSFQSLRSSSDKGRIAMIAQSVKELMIDLAYSKDNRILTLKGYQELLMSNFSRTSPKDAINTFQSILSSDKNHVPALLGLASTFSLHGNHRKSRNILKRIAKLEYCDDYWKEFERGYLLLVKEQIQRKKLDLALDLCKRCVFYNKACEQAWLLMGNIFELQNKSVSAATCFDQNYDVRQSFLRSVEQAKYLLRRGNYFKAINVATNVMIEFPDFDMTAILEKSVSGIRK